MRLKTILIETDKGLTFEGEDIELDTLAALDAVLSTELSGGLKLQHATLNGNAEQTKRQSMVGVNRNVDSRLRDPNWVPPGNGKGWNWGSERRFTNAGGTEVVIPGQWRKNPVHGRKSRRKVKSKAHAKAGRTYWQRMTAEERSVEMRKRASVRLKNQGR